MPVLSALVSPRPLPRIHVLSDVHLERGPYALPDGLEFDILVAAGDIGPVADAVPWLAALGKPVVYVMGNHEYYGEKLDEVVGKARALAQGTAVHILDGDSVVIQGVRFLGTTLWASFGQWHPALVAEGFRRMNDYRDISLGDWLAKPSRLRRFGALCRQAGLLNKGEPVVAPSAFHPAVAFMLHEAAVTWLAGKLAERCAQPTVVVTHHAPAYACLGAKGVDASMLVPDFWQRSYKNDKLVYVAAYASDLTALLRQRRANICAWVHGHIHVAQDLLVEGVRVLSNPRGRYIAPLTHESARGYALFGMHLTEDDIARSQARALEDPYRGDGWEFDKQLILDLTEGFSRPVAQLLAKSREPLQQALDDARRFAPYVFKGRAVHREAAARCFDEALETFNAAIRALESALFKQLDDFRAGLWVNHGVAGTPGWPYLPWKTDMRTPADYTRCLDTMTAWLAHLTVLPQVARGQLQTWAGHAARGLAYLKAQGQMAQVQRPALAALRHTDCHDLIFVLESALTQDQCTALEVALDKLINGGVPRDWYIRVTAHRTDWYGKPLRHLLTARHLHPFDRGLPLDLPAEPSASPAGW